MRCCNCTYLSCTICQLRGKLKALDIILKSLCYKCFAKVLVLKDELQCDPQEKKKKVCMCEVHTLLTIELEVRL